jgi:succinoglycan biosynthesis transport protein ExoP
MKELTAQLADLDKQIKLAAEKTVRGLENDARIAGARVETVSATLDEQKKTSSLANEKEIELRSLERDAKAARDQLEAYTAKYREASARDDDKAVPPDARVIAHALAPSTPSFPRKIPIISIATLATLVLSIATVVARELASPGRDPASPGPTRDKSFGRKRKAEPAVEARTPVPEALVTEGAMAALSAAMAPGAAASDEPPRSEPGDAATAPEGATVGPPISGGTDAGEPHPILRPRETEISAVAAHLVSLKPAARGIIVLLSRASDHDHAPSFSLPLGRDIAKEHRTVLVDLDRHADGLSHAIGLAEAPGLAELMANEIGFADAIHRDPHSDLHVVPAGISAAEADDPAEKGELSVVLQALARTYDAVLLDTRSIGEAAAMKRLIAAVDVTLIVRGEADEAAMAATLERFAAEKPALLLAVEPAANDDLEPVAEAVA